VRLRLTICFLATLTLSGFFPLHPSAQQIAFSTGDMVFRGDLRYRHEQISQEGQKQRDRERIRARFHVTAIVHPRANIILGIATGSNNDPISSNQDLSGGFSDKSFWIDQAYFDWTTTVTGLKFQGGKIKNPFYSVGRNQMLWDHDLNPEGLAAQFSRKNNTETREFFTNASLFWVQERGAQRDSFLLGAQAGIRQALGNFGITAGAGFFNVTNTKGFATFYDAANSFGNSADASNKYLHDYRNLEFFAECGLTKGFPVGLAFDYVINTAPHVEDNRAYIYGITFGKTAQTGSLSGRVFYRSVERDAVLGAFNDSDYAGGGTDNTGAMFGLDYQWTKNVCLNATFFLTERGIENGRDYHRLQLDTNLKF
jgi:hypothetical protein